MRLKQKILDAFSSFLKDERGQSTTEYILILAVVVMIVMKIRTTLSDKLEGAADKIGGKIDEALEF